MILTNIKCGLKNKRPKIPPLVEGVCCLKGRYVLLHQLQSLMVPYTDNNWEEKVRCVLLVIKCVKGRFHGLKLISFGSILYPAPIDIRFSLKLLAEVCFWSLWTLQSWSRAAWFVGLFVQLSEKCATMKWPIFCYKPKKFEYWPIYYWSLLRSACFSIFSAPLCGFKSI